MHTISLPGRFCILLVLASLCSSAAHSGKPDWVLKRPFLPDTYVGIGMAQKTGRAAGYASLAKNAQDPKVMKAGIRNTVGWLRSLRATGNRKRG